MANHGSTTPKDPPDQNIKVDSKNLEQHPKTINKNKICIIAKPPASKAVFRVERHVSCEYHFKRLLRNLQLELAQRSRVR